MSGMKGFFATRSVPKQPSTPPPLPIGAAKPKRELPADDEEPLGPRGWEEKRRKSEKRCMDAPVVFSDKFAECVVVEPRPHVVPTKEHLALSGRYIRVGNISGTPVFRQDPAI